MAKEKYENIEEKISQNVLSSGSIIYDGQKMEKMTVYRKGQSISEVKPEHRKHFGL